MMIFLSTLFSFEQKDKIIDYLHKRFINFYPTMVINSIKIIPNNSIDSGFSLKKIYFSKNSLKRERGNFSAIYIKNNREKRIYFKYEIDAKVKVYVANTPLKSGTKLEKDFFDTTFIKFTNFYDTPVIHLNGLELKISIPSGKILTKRMVRKIPDIHRGDIITAKAVDGKVVVYLPVKSLQDGSKGEVIRVKRENSNKILKGIILSNNKVLIK